MVKRKIADSIMRIATQFPVVAVTGPRQSGKSTLVKDLFQDKEYVTMDDLNMREIAKSNPTDFLKAFPKGVIIDEAQKVPELFDAIKFVVDNTDSQAGQYVLTGSSQFRLKENISESLAGRVGMIRLLPFSIQELRDAEILTGDAYDYALHGFYPPFYDERKSLIYEDWFENYIDTYLDMDIRNQINAANVASFRKFLQLCAVYSGQMVNMDSMSRDIGVSAQTIKSWLSVLESSYIIHFLQPETKNLGRSIVKTPKLYFVDPGLMCHLLRIEDKSQLLLSRYKGAVVETMAVAELLKYRYNQGKKPYLTFFRDKNGFEVDTIADWKKTFAIEVKSDSATEKNLSKNVRTYVEARNDDTTGKVFYLGDLTCKINGIEYVSWKDWGKVNEL